MNPTEPPPPPAAEPPAEQFTLRHVDFPAVFGLSLIFRAFRLAIEPPCWMMALLAIVLVYTAGQAFDVFWGPQVLPGEIRAFQVAAPPRQAARYATRLVRDRADRRKQLRRLLRASGASLPARRRAWLSAHVEAAYAFLRDQYEQQFRAAMRAPSLSPAGVAPQRPFIALQRGAETPPQREPDPTGVIQKGAALRVTPPASPRASRTLSSRLPPRPVGGQVARGRLADWRALATRRRTGSRLPTTALLRRQAVARLWQRMTALRRVVGRGPFDALLHDETRQFSRLVGQTIAFLQIRPGSSVGRRGRPAHLSTALLPASRSTFWRGHSIAGSLAKMIIRDPCWLAFGAAPVRRFPGEPTGQLWPRRLGYEAGVIILALLVIVAWAFTGAFICRYVGLSLAGENPDCQAVVGFAWRRLATFIKAPLLPVATMAGFGLGLVLLALPGAIPVVGNILIGVGFIIFLAGGLIILLMILGLLGGTGLIYPALAVEGADSFDAISRSFSYLYSRPWRMLLYSLLALFYGVATYLFLSFALYVLLAATHLLVGWGMGAFGLAHGWYAGQGKLDLLWAAPTFGHLISPINWWAMNLSEFLGASALVFWLYLAVSLLGAYVISYFFAVNTIIYLLLRHQVDGPTPREIFREKAP